MSDVSNYINTWPRSAPERLTGGSIFSYPYRLGNSTFSGRPGNLVSGPLCPGSSMTEQLPC